MYKFGYDHPVIIDENSDLKEAEKSVGELAAEEIKAKLEEKSDE